MERRHHPPAERERSPVDRIDVDDEARDGVSTWEPGKGESRPSVPNLAAASRSSALLLFTFFVLPFC